MPWQTHTGDDGRTYYYNPSTNESKWEKPDELLSPIERALAHSKWKEYTAQGGAKYWNNTESGESVWDTPDEIISIISSIHIPSSSNYISKSLVAPSASPPSFPDPSLAFNQMLHDHNIDPTGPWILHLKLLVQDPRYWALQAPLARKIAFDNYRDQLAIARAKAKELKQASHLNAMSIALKSKNIPYYARWASYKHSLLQDPVFSYPDEPRLAHYAFNIHVRKLRAQHNDSIANARHLRIEALNSLLPSLPISDSRWHDAAKIISAAIENIPSLQPSSRADILAAYSAYVRAQDAARNVLRQKEKKAARRRDRKARYAFVALLNDLHSQGAIRASTKWSDIRSQFLNDPRYIALCGLPGSTPIELFWDIVEEERRALNLQREQVIDLLTAKRFPLDSSFHDFALFVAQHSHLGIASENLPTIHSEIRDAATKKKDADRHADERRARRAQEELRAAIRDLDIDPSARWEDVRHHIVNLDAYDRVGEDTARDIYARLRKEKTDKRVSRYEGGVPPLPARQDGQQQYYGNGYYQDRVLDY